MMADQQNPVIELAVFGHPVAHSRSPEIHQQFARQAGIEISYQRIEAPLDGFAGAVNAFVAKGGAGFNVTVPFKAEAARLSDELSAEAGISGAVNTVTVAHNGRLLGDNTDGIGLVTDLEQRLGWEISGKSLLLVGAGGAVRGVLPALLRKRPAQIVLWNRTPPKAQKLMEDLNSQLISLGEQALADWLSRHCRLWDVALEPAGFDLVINGTSAGLSGDIPALPAGSVGQNSCCYDMLYGSQETAFNQWAKRNGAAKTADGLGMLVEQAASAFRIWTGFSPDTDKVLAHLRDIIEIN